jgi:hypothetical protein
MKRAGGLQPLEKLYLHSTTYLHKTHRDECAFDVGQIISHTYSVWTSAKALLMPEMADHCQGCPDWQRRILTGIGVSDCICIQYMQLLYDLILWIRNYFGSFLLQTPVGYKGSCCDRERLAWRLTEAPLLRRQGNTHDRERLSQHLT